MTTNVKLDELSILRAGDRFRKWNSLDDRRVCSVCERKFKGKQIEIPEIANRDSVETDATFGGQSAARLAIDLAPPMAGARWTRSVEAVTSHAGLTASRPATGAAPPG